MVPEKVRMSAGGERLEDVIGRSEGEELPEFEDGAFQINGGDEERESKKLVSGEVLNEIVPRGEVWKHTMRGLISSAWVVPAREFECHEVGVIYIYIYIYISICMYVCILSCYMCIYL